MLKKIEQALLNKTTSTRTHQGLLRSEVASFFTSSCRPLDQIKEGSDKWSSQNMKGLQVRQSLSTPSLKSRGSRQMKFWKRVPSFKEVIKASLFQLCSTQLELVARTDVHSILHLKSFSLMYDSIHRPQTELTWPLMFVWTCRAPRISKVGGSTSQNDF